MFGRRLHLPLLIVVALLALTHASSAHSPYFTRSADVPLPDGRIGKLRLLHGDGIFASDPVRLVLFDTEGRLLARSEKARSLDIVCSAQRRCWGYDRYTLELIKPVPAEFRFDGPSYESAGTLADDDLIWGLEGGLESWGFVRRPAPVREVLSGLVQELTRPDAAIGTATFTVLCFLTFLPWLPKRMDRRGASFKVAAIAIIILQLTFGLLALGAALLNFVLVTTSPLALFLAGLTGILLARQVKWLLTKRGRRTRSQNMRQDHQQPVS